ncbi:FkbM family methyltransferase [Lonepinella sp. BR2474]|uniref:FkbM family methyltransferase n=1 Tax=Lonepinella sp. BR2474 TaxID=3434548 RepID=UPI003F6DEB27
MPLAQSIPNGKLFCFEPQRVIYQYLCCNIALNDLKNVYAYQLGISDKSEIREIESTNYQIAWNYGSYSLNDGFNSEGNFTGKVEKEFLPIIPLDQHAEIQKLTSLKLLKIDAEGFDLNVINGARNLIAKHKPIIFVEVQETTFQAIKTLLERLNYRCFWFISNRYQVKNFHNSKEKKFGLTDINFICFHKDSDVIIPDFLQPVAEFELEQVRPIEIL